MWCANCRKRFKKTDKYYKRDVYGIVMPLVEGKKGHLSRGEDAYCSKQCALEYWEETDIEEVNGGKRRWKYDGSL